MKNVKLGTTGIVTPKNAFGALPVQRVEMPEAVKLLRMAYAEGFTFFDTARAYSDSEEKNGEALADVREHIFIATKTMATTVEKFWKDLETSFANLKTDYVDIYQFHNPSFCPQSGDGDIAAGAAAAISAKNGILPRNIYVKEIQKYMGEYLCLKLRKILRAEILK